MGSVTVRATNGGHYEVFFGFGASKMANSTSENACFFSMFVTTVFKRSKRRPFANPPPPQKGFIFQVPCLPMGKDGLSTEELTLKEKFALLRKKRAVRITHCCDPLCRQLSRFRRGCRTGATCVDEHFDRRCVEAC